MEFHRTVVGILLTVFLTGSSLGQDPCDVTGDGNEVCSSTHHTIIHEPNRSIAFVPSPGDSLICDNSLTKGWYRFEANCQILQIPEQCVDTDHCGTHVPLWLNGSHPTDSQVADMDVCANYGVPGDCCSLTIPIRVKRCTDDGGNAFYVYCLSPSSGYYLPNSECNQAYCAGNQMPCPAGQVWIDASGQCVDTGAAEVPVITENPVLHPPVIDFTTWKVTFTCEVKYEKDFDDGARFAVKFLFDHVEYQEVNEATQTPLDPTRKTVELDAKYLGKFVDFFGTVNWQSKMGKAVSCVVQSFWKDCIYKKSREFHSNGYFAGIKTDKTYLEIMEGQFDTVKLYSTVPFLCGYGLVYHEICNIEIGLHTFKSTGSYCRIRIYSKDWDPTTQRAEGQEINVYAIQDSQTDSNGVNVMVFEEIITPPFYDGTDGFVPGMYNGYTPDNIQVRIVAGDLTGHCRGVTISHYTTFDSKFYTIHLLGDFVFYRSLIRNLEVQVRTWYCNSEQTVVCHCAVAVREGNDAVIIDLCYAGWGNHESAYPRITVKTAHGGPLSPGVSVNRHPSNKRFEIHMPSATTVVTEINHWGVDVHAYAPATDLGHTVGLCGTWNNPTNTRNDFTQPDGSITTNPTTFGNSWRIPDGTSLFDVTCLEPDPNAPGPVQSCTCGHGGLFLCGNDQPVKQNSARDPIKRAPVQKSSRNIDCGNN